MTDARAGYLAFDLGGSGGKLVLCSFDGQRLHPETVHRFENQAIRAHDSLYWDLWHIYRQTNLGVRKALTRAGGEVRSIGLDSFSNDHVFIDARGEVLTPLRCYRDPRTERHAEAIHARMSPERLYELTGNQTAPFGTLMQLGAMREAGQGYILDNAHRMLFTPDALIHFMTGEAVAEYTMASVSQMWSFARHDWCTEILEAFSIPRRLLCRVAEPGTIVGRTTESYNREQDIPGLTVVSVCEHDTASAFLAAPLNRERAIISSGTWSLVGTEVPGPIINATGFRHNIANEGGLPGQHRLIRNVMGLWILQEILRHRGPASAEDFADLEALAARAAPFAHRIDPDDGAFYAPRDMVSAVEQRCQDAGGRAPNTLGQTVRCVVECLALKYRWAIEKIEELTGGSLPGICIVGGGSRNRLLCQFTANACGRPVVAGPAEATAVGNVLVQLLAHRQISSLEQGKDLVKASFEIEEYFPQETGVWEQEYGEFKRAFGLE
jgi:sugar (pentulose or hexulose) kinase